MKKTCLSSKKKSTLRSSFFFFLFFSPIDFEPVASLLSFSSEMPGHLRRKLVPPDDGLDQILCGKNTAVLADTVHFESRNGENLK